MLYDASQGLDLPDESEIEKAQAQPEPLERTRHLYQLSIRYRELARQALELSKDACNEANAQGHALGRIAGHAGASSSSIFQKSKKH